MKSLDYTAEREYIVGSGRERGEEKEEERGRGWEMEGEGAAVCEYVQ